MHRLLTDEKPFDHVDIWVANWDGGANDSVYELQILDEKGTAVAYGEIVGAAAPCMDACTVSFEESYLTGNRNIGFR